MTPSAAAKPDTPTFGGVRQRVTQSGSKSTLTRKSDHCFAHVWAGWRGARISDCWLILAALFLGRTAIAFQFQTIASAGPFLIDELTIDFASVGLLIGLYMLPGVVFALPGGMLGQQFGAKKIVLVGLASMAAGGILASYPSLGAIFAGRIVSGTGAALINVLMTKMVSDWFAGRDIATAMSVLVASWPLGLGLGLTVYPPLAISLGWSAIMLTSSLAALGSLLVVWRVYRDPPHREEVDAVGLTIALSRHEWVLVSLAGAIWGTFNVVYVVHVSFLPELFTASGYSRSEASALVSILGWALIPLVPIGGYMADRIRRPTLLMFGGFLVLGLTTAVLPFTNFPWVSVSLIVVGFAAPASLILTLPATALTTRNRSAGMGIFYTWFYFLMAVLPPIAGTILEATGSLSAPVLFSAMMVVVSIACLISFRLVLLSGKRII